MNGAELIAAERERQITEEGWTPEHDAEHGDGQLLDAARTYLSEGDYRARYPNKPHNPTLALTICDLHGFPASTWPWAAKWWKPSADPVPNLVKAGALIAAEIDRLAASAGSAPSGGEGSG